MESAQNMHPTSMGFNHFFVAIHAAVDIWMILSLTINVCCITATTAASDATHIAQRAMHTEIGDIKVETGSDWLHVFTF